MIHEEDVNANWGIARIKIRAIVVFGLIPAISGSNVRLSQLFAMRSSKLRQGMDVRCVRNNEPRSSLLIVDENVSDSGST